MIVAGPGVSNNTSATVEDFGFWVLDFRLSGLFAPFASLRFVSGGRGQGPKHRCSSVVPRPRPHFCLLHSVFWLLTSPSPLGALVVELRGPGSGVRVPGPDHRCPSVFICGYTPASGLSVSPWFIPSPSAPAPFVSFVLFVFTPPRPRPQIPFDWPGAETMISALASPPATCAPCGRGRCAADRLRRGRR